MLLETRDGMRHRDQGEHASAVHRRAAWRCARDLRRRNLAAWLYDLLKPHVREALVCNPRKNALLKDGSKSDRIDARKLAELLSGNHLKPVYHAEQGLRALKELARSYLNISKDVTRVMNRLKAAVTSGFRSACRNSLLCSLTRIWTDFFRAPLRLINEFQTRFEASRMQYRNRLSFENT
jgi:hypothetical protein